MALYEEINISLSVAWTYWYTMFSVIQNQSRLDSSRKFEDLWLAGLTLIKDSTWLGPDTDDSKTELHCIIYLYSIINISTNRLQQFVNVKNKTHFSWPLSSNWFKWRNWGRSSEFCATCLIWTMTCLDLLESHDSNLGLAHIWLTPTFVLNWTDQKCYTEYVKLILEYK